MPLDIKEYLYPLLILLLLPRDGIELMITSRVGPVVVLHHRVLVIKCITIEKYKILLIYVAYIQKIKHVKRAMTVNFFSMIN